MRSGSEHGARMIAVEVRVANTERRCSQEPGKNMKKNSEPSAAILSDFQC